MKKNDTRRKFRNKKQKYNSLIDYIKAFFNNKGFTLIELLAVIFVISLLFGISSFFMNNVINASKNKSISLSSSNVKSAAELYIREYSNNVEWTTMDDGGNSTTCVLIEDLVDSGFLKQKDIDNLAEYDSVSLTKNSNGSIINMEFDNGRVCGNVRVDIPTAKKNCNNLVYDDSNKTLAKTSSDASFELIDNVGRDAGEYVVTASLTDKANKTWRDGTIEDKKIICTIKKATPYFAMSPTGINPTDLKVGDVKEVTLTSGVKGSISAVSTNNDYVTASLDSNQIEKDGTTKMKVKILSTRKATTYVRVTLTPETPDDLKNYNSYTITYTVGDVKKKSVDVPTNSLCMSDLDDDGTEKMLVNMNDVKEGYTLFNVIGKNYGEYVVTAKLNYGYIWNDDTTTNDKTFKCRIYEKYNVTYDYNYLPDDIYGYTPLNVGNWSQSTTTISKRNYVDNQIAKGGAEMQFTLTGGTGGIHIQPPSRLTIGQKYTWSVYLKANRNITLNLVGQEEGGRKSINVTTSWQRFDFTYTAVANNYYSFTFYTGTGSSWNNNDVLYVHSLEIAKRASTYSTTERKIYNTNLGTLDTPTRVGYTFDGWYTASSGGSKISDTTKVPKGDVTYYARWKAISYNLDLNGKLDGTDKSNITGYGKVDVYINGVKKGEDVSDYSANHYYGTYYEFKDIKATAGHNYVGVDSGYLSNNIAGDTSTRLEFSSNIYNVSLNKNNGTGGTSNIYEKYGIGWYNNSSGTGTKITTVTKPTRSYVVTFGSTGSGTAISTFNGYYNSTSGTTRYINSSGSITASNTVTSGSMTWYAQWTGGSVICPTPNAQAGKVFNGWYSGTVKRCAGGGSYTPTQTETLTPSWTDNVYTVTLNRNGGSGGTGTIYEKYGIGWYSNNTATTAISTITKPTRSYVVTFGSTGSGTAISTFNGYYNSTSGTTRYINSSGSITASNTVTSSSMTWYAQWTGGSVICPTPNAQAGKVFNGWYSGTVKRCSGGGSYTPTQTETLTPSWTDSVYTDDVYTVTLDRNGGSGGTGTIYEKYGIGWYSNNTAKTAITSITCPSKTGYTVTFKDGSSTLDSKTSSYTFGGYYDGNTQKINSSGSITASNSSVTSAKTWTAQWTGSSITCPTPTAAGKVFNGWYSGTTRKCNGGASYTPTSSGTLTASWSTYCYRLSNVNNGGYNKLSDAIRNVNSSGTITLQKQCTDNGEDVTLGKNVTLNLGSFTINRGSKKITVGSGGNLTLSGSGKITGTSTVMEVGANNANFVMTGGTIENTSSSGNSLYLTAGKAQISGGTISGSGTAINIYSNTAATASAGVQLKITGGLFSSSTVQALVIGDYSNSNYHHGLVSIHGGTFISTSTLDDRSTIVNNSNDLWPTSGNTMFDTCAGSSCSLIIRYSTDINRYGSSHASSCAVVSQNGAKTNFSTNFSGSVWNRDSNVLCTHGSNSKLIMNKSSGHLYQPNGKFSYSNGGTVTISLANSNKHKSNP